MELIALLLAHIQHVGSGLEVVGLTLNPLDPSTDYIQLAIRGTSAANPLYVINDVNYPKDTGDVNAQDNYVRAVDNTQFFAVDQYGSVRQYVLSNVGPGPVVAGTIEFAVGEVELIALLLAHILTNVNENVEYDLYLDDYGYVRAYNNKTSYALVTEVYNTNRLDEFVISAVNAVVEVSGGTVSGSGVSDFVQSIGSVQDILGLAIAVVVDDLLG